MIKQNKKTLILTSIITLLPIIFGYVVWNILPESLPVHWNIKGEVDGYMPKWFVVLVLPVILVSFEWLCVFFTMLDPKRKNISKKSLGVVLWIIPILSLLLNVMTYTVAFDIEININFIVSIILGIMLVIIGNIMPKTQQNYSFGYKIRWTLHSEENWNATHRFCGKIQVIGGILVILLSFLQIIWISLGITFACVIAPVIYSYIYYVKHEKK